MEPTSIKAMRSTAKAWLETPEKQTYTALMDKMEAGDLRSMVLAYAVRTYRETTPDLGTETVKQLQSYYAHPLKFEKEILTL